MEGGSQGGSGSDVKVARSAVATRLLEPGQPIEAAGGSAEKEVDRTLTNTRPRSSFGSAIAMSAMSQARETARSRQELASKRAREHLPNAIVQLVHGATGPRASSIKVMAAGIFVQELAERIFVEVVLRAKGEELAKRNHLHVWMQVIRDLLRRLFEAAHDSALDQDDESRTKLLALARISRAAFNQIYDDLKEEPRLLPFALGAVASSKIVAQEVVDSDTVLRGLGRSISGTKCLEDSPLDCKELMKNVGEMIRIVSADAKEVSDAATMSDEEIFLKRHVVCTASTHGLCWLIFRVAAATCHVKIRNNLLAIAFALQDSLNHFLSAAAAAVAEEQPALVGAKRKDTSYRHLIAACKSFSDLLNYLVRPPFKIAAQHAIAVEEAGIALSEIEEMDRRVGELPGEGAGLPQESQGGLTRVQVAVEGICRVSQDLNLVFCGARLKVNGIEKMLLRKSQLLVTNTSGIASVLTDANVHMNVDRGARMLQNSIDLLLVALEAAVRVDARVADSRVKLMSGVTDLAANSKSLDRLVMLHQQVSASILSLSRGMTQISTAVENTIRAIRKVMEKSGGRLPSLLSPVHLGVEEEDASGEEPKSSGGDAEFEELLAVSYEELPDSPETIRFMDPEAEGDMNDPNNVPESNWNIKAGTLDKLVERLTTERLHDLKYVKAFLATYRSFTSPKQLFVKLVQRYSVRYNEEAFPDKEAWRKRVALPVQLRVCNVLKQWIENYFFDFSETLLRLVFLFIRRILPADGNSRIAGQLEKAIQKKSLPSLGILSSGAQKKERMDRPTRVLAAEFFFDFDTDTIAKQLTLIDFSYYAAIQPAEFLNQAWSNPKQKHRAPNLLATIARFNQISHWISSVLLWTDDPKLRAKLLVRILQLAEVLLRLNNFSSVMAILSALNSSAIHRLRQTWKVVPQKLLESMAELQEVMSSQHAFKKYRAHLHKINPPCVPYLGVYLTDLTFIEDGNPSLIENALINFQKRKLTYNVVSEIQQYQQVAYTTPVVPACTQVLAEVPHNEMEHMYDMSLLLEPKE